MGAKYAEQGRHSEAIAAYEQSVEIFRSIGDRQSEGQTLARLGRAYAAIGSRADAIVAYEQSLIIAQELGDLKEVALRQKLLAAMTIT